MKTKSITIDELPDIEREKRVLVALLTQRGVSAEDALKLFEIMPELGRMQRLLSANEGILREFLRELRELRAAQTNEGDRP